MRWDNAMAAVIVAIAEDAELEGVTVQRWGEFDEASVPSIAWLQIDEDRGENTVSARFQFDIFAADYNSVLAIEERLRAILDNDTPRVIGGLLMWSYVSDSRGNADPGYGTAHRSIDFVFEPTR